MGAPDQGVQFIIASYEQLRQERDTIVKLNNTLGTINLTCRQNWEREVKEEREARERAEGALREMAAYCEKRGKENAARSIGHSDEAESHWYAGKADTYTRIGEKLSETLEWFLLRQRLEEMEHNARSAV